MNSRERAAAAPNGFSEVIAFSGLVNPTAFRFAPDGRIFVAEKRGTIQMYDGLDDVTPTQVADLRTEVHNFWDRGLLGLAIDPAFPARPYLYVLYTYDGAIGGAAPRWGAAGQDSDPCPDPPGATGDGCVVSGKLARLTLNGTTTTKQDLINDWCQQYPSHSIGDLRFGNDGALYVSAGDGAAFDFVDFGQDGSPVNPCGDPPGGVGATLTAPTAEGGALRSQDLRTTTDPAGLDGTLIRVSPDTGAALDDNPAAGATDPNVKRIIASGFRNPFRMTVRPGTNEIWLGDVGWDTYEEIDRITDPRATPLNFGWPCYEGNDRQPAYDAADLSICEGLYQQGNADTKPYYAYRHGQPLNQSDNCNTTRGSSLAGISFEFYTGGPYPSEYDGALFFSDYSRNCIWTMPAGADGLPDKLKAKPLLSAAASPVDLELSPGGELFYADFNGGTIRRILYGVPGPTSCPSGQFLAEYFANKTLSGTPSSTACEPAPLDHDWGIGSPAGVGPDNFSARWSGSFNFATGATYSFTAVSDDGIRVWVDGGLLIDEWRDQSATAFTAARTLTAGTHDIRVEFFDSGVDAVAKLDWSATTSSSCGSGLYRAEYFANKTLSGTPASIACEPPPLDHDWGSGSPAGVGPDNFSARWKGTFDFLTAGTYTFTAVSDDGIRVFIDGALVIDEWRDQPPTQFAAARTLSAGSHDVQVDWFETGGGAVAKLSWALNSANSPPTPTIDSPAAGTTWKVGDTITFSGSATDAEDGVLPASSLFWEMVLQHCPSDCHAHSLQTWSGVAGGSISAPDHEYPSYLELRLTATDSKGTAVTVTRRLDPQTVGIAINSKPAGLQITIGQRTAVTPFTATLIVGATTTLSASSPQTLAGGSYTFTGWSDGGAQTHNITVGPVGTSFTASYVLTCAPGQFRAEYFANRTVTGTPATAVCEDAPLNRNWGSGGPAGVGINNFSARWTGDLAFAGGATTFTAASDDGMRVWLDGVLIVDRWTGAGTSTVTRAVTAGTHQVRVEYFEKTGNAFARLSW